MKLIWKGGLKIESETLKFFTDQRDFPNVNCTHKKNKEGFYIFHVSLLWYHPLTGEALQVNVGRIFLNSNDYWALYNNKDVPIYREEMEKLLKRAERDCNLLFQQVLRYVFN